MAGLSRSKSSPRYGAARRARNLGGALALLLALPAAAEPITIAALGDSLTQGYGLPREEGFVPQLEGWLRQNGGGEVALINAGVSGDTTAGGLSRIDWTLAGQPVDALIVALGGNDLLRGIDPATTRANLDGILRIAAEAGLPTLLIGLPAPGNYGPEYKAAFDAIFPELAQTHGALWHENFLGALSARAEEPGAVARLMQPDGIHPSAEGVALIVQEIGPKVLDLIARAGSQAPRG